MSHHDPSDLSVHRAASQTDALVPSGYAEKAMASLMQLHSELMEEKERRVDLYRRLMEKEQSIAELKMYVKLLEEKAQAADAARAAHVAKPPGLDARVVTPPMTEQTAAPSTAHASATMTEQNVARATPRASVSEQNAAAGTVGASTTVPPVPSFGGNEVHDAVRIPSSDARPVQFAQPTKSQPLPRVQSAAIPGPAFPKTAPRKIEDWKTW